jgi:CubicO group peptidase (beta-lactamase class C family)
MKHPRSAVLFLATTASVSAAPARAQSVANHPRVVEATTVVEKWLDAERAYDRIPGVSAAVVLDQEVIWQGGFGYADLQRRTPATPTTLYSICSISKLFTSVALMQLRDQGKVRLDDPVGKHLPWFTIKNPAPEAGPVTIEGILTHASGLPREAAYPYWSAPSFEFPTRDQIITAVSGQEMLYRPETFFQYSNLGLTLAGEVVAAASGRPYAEYVRANILEPLAMKDTHPDMPVEERGRRLATGYGAWEREGDRRVLPFYQTKGIAAAAGYASTALDLAKFASWQFRVLARTETEILDANTLREMHRVHFIDPDWETTWGLGFAVSRSDGKTFVGHGGSCPGYRTELLLKTDERIATIAMTNAIDANASALARRTYELVAPALKAAKDDSGKTKPADPALEPYLGGYAASFGGEMHVIRWEGGLATLYLPTDNPARSITKYRKTGDHTFKRIRRDGELGEALTFEIGPDGRAARVRVNYNVMPRIGIRQ